MTNGQLDQLIAENAPDLAEAASKGMVSETDILFAVVHGLSERVAQVERAAGFREEEMTDDTPDAPPAVDS